MAIIEKMMIIASVSIFWGAATYGAMQLVPRTEGTLLDCKFNQKMDQPICKPFTMKNRSQ